MGARKISYAEIPLFEGIAAEDLGLLLPCLKGFQNQYRKGEYILLEQDQVQTVGIVLSGRVHMLKEDLWGHQTLLAYMTPGELFGETFALQRERNSCVSFWAARDSEILFLSLENLLAPCPKRCDFHVHLGRNMFHLLGEKNVQLMEKIEVSSKGTLREKILTYLSLQAQKQGGKYITVPLNRTEMASFLHSNRSAMTRELAEMKAEGILDYDGDTFFLKK